MLSFANSVLCGSACNRDNSHMWQRLQHTSLELANQKAVLRTTAVSQKGTVAAATPKDTNRNADMRVGELTLFTRLIVR